MQHDVSGGLKPEGLPYFYKLISVAFDIAHFDARMRVVFQPQRSLPRKSRVL